MNLVHLFQVIDAASKDGAIKHVMSEVNPQGCQVSKAPSSDSMGLEYAKSRKGKNCKVAGD